MFGGKPLVWSGGRGGAYALGDQVIWRPETTGQRGLAVFATAGVPFDGKGLFSFEGVAGAIWTGPFASRPADQVGLMGTYIRLSDKEDGNVNDLLRKVRSNSLVSRNQAIFEANYNYRVTEGTYLAGSLQYLVNPDPISQPSARFAPKNALVVGLKLSVSLNALFGLLASLADD